MESEVLDYKLRKKADLWAMDWTCLSEGTKTVKWRGNF